MRALFAALLVAASSHAHALQVFEFELVSDITGLTIGQGQVEIDAAPLSGTVLALHSPQPGTPAAISMTHDEATGIPGLSTTTDYFGLGAFEGSITFADGKPTAVNFIGGVTVIGYCCWPSFSYAGYSMSVSGLSYDFMAGRSFEPLPGVDDPEFMPSTELRDHGRIVFSNPMVPVPEPSTYALLIGGLLLLAASRRVARRRSR